MAAPPALSVVIPTDALETIRVWLRHLEAQTVRDRIELVLVTPPGVDVSPEGLASFARVVVVEAPLDSVAQARLAGLRRAGAPIVAFSETHSFPAPGWAAALIEGHRGPWAAVGPAVTNANPGRALGWAAFLLDYGPWAEPSAAREVDELPGHNSAYKRELLLDPAVAPLLEAESVLQAHLRAQGSRLYFEPAASTAHLNVTRPGSWARERILAGRQFAATRALAWPRSRRLAYAVAWPLIPLVRLPRVRRDAARIGGPASRPRLLPAVLAALVLSALGEAAGYALGAGEAPERLADIELHRERHAAT